MLIRILIFVLLCSPSFAQENQKFDTTFPNTSSIKYFQQNPPIKKVSFYTGISESRSLSIYPKTIWQASENENYVNRNNYESFDLSFQGDLYLLGKKYGLINFPEKEINELVKKTCGKKFSLRGIITPDSIHLQLTYNCITKPIDPEEKIFVKIEKERGYKGGVKKLKQHLEDEIKNKNISLSKNIEDSVLIFTAVLSKDSSLLRLELIEGNYSAFSQAIMDFLIKPRTWLPTEAGGRPVKSYSKIFIRLHKDKSLTVHYPE